MSSKKESLILTSYFSINPHPNDPDDPAVVGRGSDGRVARSDINYIKKWYDSVLSNKLKAVVFHDNLDDALVEEYSNDLVSFVRVEPTEYSNNDYRFFCFRDFLLNIDSKPDVVFHTDASDVVIVKDPIHLIEENKSIDYFACKDSIMLNEFPYMKIHEHFGWGDSFNFMINYTSWELINMGVVGGSFDKMLNFYENFVEVRESMGKPEFNSDMWVLQYLLRSKLQPCNFIMGDPVCSEFKGYQDNRDDVYFIHK